ncbi:phage repressor protein [Natrarchaeobius chitinivorans]|uniref:Phage repressor protein n=2 Tax=Natrarchaeobius chitinivorans TaxID=1679083 RepID=A0A3N6NAZ2_NATCH|nr:phage repressor protein [Natrarchaeobius chitinivorans]
MASELSKLREYDLAEQVGPAERSGMSTTTDLGEFVLSKRSIYEHAQAELFEQLVDTAVEYAGTLSQETDDEITPDEIIISSNEGYEMLDTLDRTGRSTPREIADPEGRNLFAVRGVLYELLFFGLVDREISEDGEEYRITELGHRVLEETSGTGSALDINREWLGIPKRDGESAQEVLGNE